MGQPCVQPIIVHKKSDKACTSAYRCHHQHARTQRDTSTQNQEIRRQEQASPLAISHDIPWIGLACSTTTAYKLEPFKCQALCRLQTAGQRSSPNEHEWEQLNDPVHQRTSHSEIQHLQAQTRSFITTKRRINPCGQSALSQDKSTARTGRTHHAHQREDRWTYVQDVKANHAV